MKDSITARILGFFMETTIQGNRVLLPDGSCEPASLVCVDGQIESVTGRGGPASFEADDLLVVPGIVDLHGDAFERQIHPRPGIGFPVEVGLVDTDRQLIANGITTAFHGLTVTWEPGTRDVHAARKVLSALGNVRSRLRCDTLVHLRHEVLSLDTVDECCEWIREGLISLVAINDHREMVRRSLASGVSRGTVAVAGEEYIRMAHSFLSRHEEVPASLEKLTAVAREFGVPLASHDDNTPEERTAYRALGCRMCEFPADRATAGCARDAGDDVILGCPNILRGGSHCGRVGAGEMIAEGLCTVLCSDYYYPSILVAPFLLAAGDVVSLARAWELVSAAPARAAGLNDRGSTEPGKRADLLFIDESDPMHPEVRAVFVQGELVYTREPRRRKSSPALQETFA